MIETKIQLSAAEMELMCDADVILTKNVVIAKTKTLLEAVQTAMQEEVEKEAARITADIITTSPKIAKGENYLGLPYLVLDYPRIFKGNDILAVRSFFWWGRFFSSTWHIAGSYKNHMIPRLQQAYAALAPHHFIGVNADPWQHHFERNNYTPIAALTEANFKNLLLRSDHIKIAAQHPLTHWHSAANMLLQNWKLFLNLYKS